LWSDWGKKENSELIVFVGGVLWIHVDSPVPLSTPYLAKPFGHGCP
jgi:hypothetical protein